MFVGVAAWGRGLAMRSAARAVRLVAMAATGTGTGIGTGTGYKRPHPEPAARIGTHDGTFHCDEVLACFLLRLLPRYRVRLRRAPRAAAPGARPARHPARGMNGDGGTVRRR